MHHNALIHDVGAVRNRQRALHVLFNQQQRGAVLFHGGEQVEHFIDQHRHDALRRLIKQNHFRLRHHRARNGKHLLFAARERRCFLRQPFF